MKSFQVPVNGLQEITNLFLGLKLHFWTKFQTICTLTIIVEEMRKNAHMAYPSIHIFSIFILGVEINSGLWKYWVWKLIQDAVTSRGKACRLPPHSFFGHNSSQNRHFVDIYIPLDRGTNKAQTRAKIQFKYQKIKILQQIFKSGQNRIIEFSACRLPPPKKMLKLQKI